MRAAAIALLVAPCVACSPRYDWREIRPAELHCLVMLPGKPVSMTREIDLDGMPVTMTMHGARVDGASFTVAMARLPDDRADTRAKAVSAMQRGMLRNISAAPASATARAATVAVVGASGATIASVPASRLEATGKANGRPVRMVAGFTARGARAWQWTAIGQALDEEQARVFADSFRLTAGESK